MPQINNGKSPPWVAGEIVTAAELNGMIDSATINPSVITDQPNLTTLTNDEYALVVDTAGALKKTQLKKINEAGVVTDKILGLTAGTDLTIQPSGTSNFLRLYGGSSGGIGQQIGTINLEADFVGIWGQTIGSSGGGISFTAGSAGVVFASAGGVVFSSNVQFTTTDAVKLPVGTTAQRPAVPSTGEIRYNTTTGKLEFYNGSSWKNTQEAIATGMLLYDVYEESIGYGYGTSNGMVYWTSSPVTKPSNEIWIVESDFFYSSTSNGYFYWYNLALSTQYKSLYINSGSGQRSSGFVIGAGTTLTSESFVLYRGAVGSSGSTVVQITLSNTGVDDNKLRIYKYRPA